MSARESGSQSLPSILHSNPNSPVSSPTLYQNTFRGLSSPYSLTHHGIHRYYGRCSFPPSCRLSQILALLAHPHIHSPQFPIVRNKFYLGTPVVTPNMDSEILPMGQPTLQNVPKIQRRQEKPRKNLRSKTIHQHQELQSPQTQIPKLQCNNTTSVSIRTQQPYYSSP